MKLRRRGSAIFVANMNKSLRKICYSNTALEMRLDRHVWDSINEMRNWMKRNERRKDRRRSDVCCECDYSLIDPIRGIWYSNPSSVMPRRGHRPMEIPQRKLENWWNRTKWEREAKRQASRRKRKETTLALNMMLWWPLVQMGRVLSVPIVFWCLVFSLSPQSFVWAAEKDRPRRWVDRYARLRRILEAAVTSSAAAGASETFAPFPNFHFPSFASSSSYHYYYSFFFSVYLFIIFLSGFFFFLLLFMVNLLEIFFIPNQFRSNK